MSTPEHRRREVPPRAYLSTTSSLQELLDDLSWRAALLRDALAEQGSPLTADAIKIVDVLNLIADPQQVDEDEM